MKKIVLHKTQGRQGELSTWDYRLEQWEDGKLVSALRVGNRNSLKLIKKLIATELEKGV